MEGSFSAFAQAGPAAETTQFRSGGAGVVAMSQ
ncbi:hypothetical protein FOQG_08333 [Fusarium oxysporum f. sp. raphani 54005]|uniref:Uncharacterized protein n=7 Tax=Fusarium oxysporum TaxID=5507 RepID=W9IRR9_FUSOX|nr:hypothetical protein FOXG_18309 [Fusarium oxysporum f. sp. lycopersici 4287]EWY97658.1 hypothetical protein FOYG_02462 [Fusarium oxysporum NRRL 32931]EWZ43737.1 hypothetical protein FOZG_04799 [Fusarium oxysporum Fo47]EWZ99393.1 hypothetical protein FOWG_03084 [Fusarium oxysporum f. sp. lycopersici MN25]EXA49016.1 hypothetical protein FOVG_02327 [Fusarium oxysporum f. sp. pisi HDV247]EXK41086.1 hypothetical protein FOMG_04623 [Fusarium oxysporum f. sp. melonis 26406]EXK88521.1 hypothetical